MRTAQNSQKIMTTKITVTALLTAVAIALQYIEVPIPLVPSFLKLDFSDLPELIGAFVLGPQYGIIICLLKKSYSFTCIKFNVCRRIFKLYTRCYFCVCCRHYLSV